MSTPQIRVRWRSGDRTFAPGTPVLLGRDPSATIRLDDERVSRIHAELRSDEQGWHLIDRGSTSGTFIGSQRITELVVRAPTTLRFGGLSSAEDVHLELVAEPGGLAPPTQIAGPMVLDHTVLPPGAPTRPGGALAPGAAGATEISDATLQVMIAGQTRTLHPGQVLTIGRDPSADLPVENPTVSRAHARLAHGERGWTIEDLGSTRGTFRDGKRITREDLRGSMAYVLGPPGSGERLVVVAAGSAPTSMLGRARASRNLALVAIATAVVAIVAIVAVVLVDRGDDASAKLDVDDLRAATVRILTDTGRGSGTIVDGELGLILTNAHVVRPDAPGQGVLYGEIESQLETSPAEVVILVSKGADEPAEPEYRGEVVAADGYLDLAVVRITETYGGRIISPTEDLGLPSVPIGDSTAIGQADHITVFGFPGVADSDAAQKTEGAVSGFISDPRLSTNRAFINSDVSIAPGNSGGLAADEQGRLIGVPTSERSNGTDSFSRLRPVHLALDLIDAARTGTEYTSDFVTPATTEEITDVSFATDGPPFATSCRDRRADTPGSDAALSIAFAYEGFPTGHQDVLVTIVSNDEVIGRIAANEVWPVEWDGEGCAAVTVPIFDPATFEPAALQSGQQISIFVDVGPNYEKSVLAEQVVVA